MGRKDSYNISRSSTSATRMQEGLDQAGGRRKYYHEEQGPETAVLVGLITPQQNERKTQEYLDELEFLATTAKKKLIVIKLIHKYQKQFMNF